MPRHHHVLDPVGVRAVQARLRQRLQIAVEGGEHLVAGRRVQLDAAAAGHEAPLEVADLGHRCQQPEPGQRAGVAQRVQQRALGGVQREGRQLLIAGALGPGGQRVDALAVGGGVGPHQVGDLLVAERLGVADQRDRGGEPLEIPGERADIGLVEVVDVEDQPTRGVHVGAEVLGVQIAVDPHPAGPLVQIRSAVLYGLRLQVPVEQARRAPVEGEGGGGHLPEFHAEGRGVGGEQLSEGGVEDGEDLLAALRGVLCRGVLGRHRWVPPEVRRMVREQ